jgi:primosomal protein N' (replication factor Y)
VANSKPLSLRQQRAGNKKRNLRDSDVSIQAEVLVDTGVYHLNETYSYYVPRDLHEISVGSVVAVPFNSMQTIGVVLNLGPVQRAGLKSVVALASNYEIPQTLMQMASTMTNMYICSLIDAYRFVLPPLSKKIVSRENGNILLQNEKKSKFSCVITNIGERLERTIHARVERVPNLRRICIVPTVKELENLCELFRQSGIAFVEYGSHLSSSQRASAYKEIAEGLTTLVVGTRSAIFAPMRNLDEIIVTNEAHEQMYEQRSPYWSVREIAKLRGTIEGAQVFFLSPAPSSDLMYEVDQERVAVISKKGFAGLRNRPRISCAPRNYLETLRRGMKEGPVLVTVAEKGFSNLFICKRCRNVARCKCGGRISIAQRNRFVCGLCSDENENWRCKECSSQDFVMLRTGGEKIVEELGKSLPGISIFLSTADKRINEIGADPVVIIATSGMEPTSENGYAAIALLNGEELMSRPFVRSDEELLQRWFNSLQHLRRNGEIFISLPAAHRLSQSIMVGDSTRFFKEELEERKTLGLPPANNLILVESKNESLSTLRGKLMKEFPESIANLSANSRLITIILPRESRAAIVASLKALQKVRSINRKDLLKITVNPYRF